MNRKKFLKNPFLFFSPFLILFLTIVLFFPTNGNHGDENNYLSFAKNIINGFYSPAAPAINLQNGPGYPLIISSFLALNIPIIFIAIFNAVFFYLSIVILFKSLLNFTNRMAAVTISIFWGLYYNLYNLIPYILPEILTIFLISMFIFFIINSFEDNSLKKSLKPIFLSGIILGYLALTKPIFGYVILTLFICSVLLLIINRKSLNYRKSIAILFVSLLTIAPYLFYTFNLTGKVFYLSTVGGNNLYWMSTPYEYESGSWIQYPVTVKRTYQTEESKIMIENLHKKDLDEILKYKGVSQDSMYKKKAIENIKKYPVKFLKNIFSNISRMIFNFPYSYELQGSRTLLRMPHNGIILVFSIFFLIPTLINWKRIEFSIRFLLFFMVIYLGGSLLGSAEIRMFAIIVPILLIWIAYIFERTVKLKINWAKSAT